MTHKKESEDHRKLICATSYLLIGVIWYFVTEDFKKDSLVKFHVKQGINLIVFSLAFSVINSFFVFLFMIPYVGALFSLLFSIIGIGLLVITIIGIINGYNEKKKKLPIIGSFAEKYLHF